MTVLRKLRPYRTGWNDKVEGPGSFDDFVGQKPLSVLESTLPRIVACQLRKFIFQCVSYTLAPWLVAANSYMLEENHPFDTASRDSFTQSFPCIQSDPRPVLQD